MSVYNEGESIAEKVTRFTEQLDELQRDIEKNKLDQEFLIQKALPEVLKKYFAVERLFQSGADEITIDSLKNETICLLDDIEEHKVKHELKIFEIKVSL